MEIDTLDKIVTKLTGRLLALEVMQSCMLPLLSSSFKDPGTLVDWITDNAVLALEQSNGGAYGEFETVKAEAMEHLKQQVIIIKHNTETLLRQRATVESAPSE